VTSLSHAGAPEIGGPDPEALKVLIEGQLDDDKAENIVTIDLAGKTAIADYMIIASGRSARQVGAMADHLTEKLKAAGSRELRIEGKNQADWVLIDAGDIIVHLFRPEVRDFYRLDEMWQLDAAPPERTGPRAAAEAAWGPLAQDGSTAH